MRTEPQVSAGILSATEISFIFNGKYRLAETDDIFDTKQTAKISSENKIIFQEKIFEELNFEPLNNDANFDLTDVLIGINFHWQQKENQRFSGKLKIIIENDKLTAINILPVEDYLTSVISSEMSATASLELLKAHAVISRSWLLANIECRMKNEECHAQTNNSSFFILHSTFIKWYERDAHTNFDVCADDHCQRYQGITRASTPEVQQAIAETRGQVLTYEGKICDARFSKCCGGITERFSSCWADVDFSYLTPIQDFVETLPATSLPDLTIEKNADEWIRTAPPAFCNTSDKKILSQVLNNYDQTTTDFYRWQVRYTQAELQEIIRSRLNMDLGEIIDLVPIKRGDSGRIVLLKIIGTKSEITIGKELEIRKTLSRTHLYSSAFVVDKAPPSSSERGGVPSAFLLRGAGWGHGVGLCQIGAAVMGERGCNYQQILAHYYKGAQIKELY